MNNHFLIGFLLLSMGVQQLSASSVKDADIDLEGEDILLSQNAAQNTSAKPYTSSLLISRHSDDTEENKIVGVAPDKGEGVPYTQSQRELNHEEIFK